MKKSKKYLALFCGTAMLLLQCDLNSMQNPGSPQDTDGSVSRSRSLQGLSPGEHAGEVAKCELLAAKVDSESSTDTVTLDLESSVKTCEVERGHCLEFDHCDGALNNYFGVELRSMPECCSYTEYGYISVFLDMLSPDDFQVF